MRHIALWTAFPPSTVGRDSDDYYESYAPTRRHQQTLRLACLPKEARRHRAGSHVHCRSFGGVGVQLFPAGLVWRSRHTPPNDNRRRREPGSPQIRVPAHRLPGPYLSGLSRGCSLEGVQSLVHSHHTLSALLAAPARSDSPRASRRCQGCLPPFPAAPGSGCPQLHRAAATTQRWGLAPHTNQQRLVAHLGVKPQIRVGALKRPAAERLDLLSSARHSAETRSLVIPSIPSCSTSRSTLRVLTPLT